MFLNPRSHTKLHEVKILNGAVINSSFLRQLKTRALAWLPAVILMAAIFGFSAMPADALPSFNWADLLVKKGAHMLGYGLLALAYLYAFQLDSANLKVAWLLALLYAISDEYHQGFVPGRNGTWIDVVIDGAGAALALAWVKRKLPRFFS